MRLRFQEPRSRFLEVPSFSEPSGGGVISGWPSSRSVAVIRNKTASGDFHGVAFLFNPFLIKAENNANEDHHGLWGRSTIQAARLFLIVGQENSRGQACRSGGLVILQCCATRQTFVVLAGVMVEPASAGRDSSARCVWCIGLGPMAKSGCCFFGFPLRSANNDFSSHDSYSANV